MLDKTVLVDAQYHTDSKTRISLPKEVFRAPTAKLHNVGFTSTSANTFFNGINGAKSAVKAMYLKYGELVIDQYVRQKVVSSVDSLLRSNSQLQELDRFTDKNRMGFNTDYSNNDLKINVSTTILPATLQLAAAEADTPKTWLLLSDFLSLNRMNS